MQIVRIEHPVPDYDAWKRAFDSDPPVAFAALRLPQRKSFRSPELAKLGRVAD